MSHYTQDGVALPSAGFRVHNMGYRKKRILPALIEVSTALEGAERERFYTPEGDSAIANHFER